MAECLLIDGNEFERARVMEQVRGLGLSIAERAGSLDGLRYCNDNQPDLVLMSADGGEAKAGEFISRVRKTRQGTRPVVMVYGPHPQPDVVGQAILDGAADFVMLPVDADTLAFKLRQAGIL